MANFTKIQTVTVVGAGFMGWQIAARAAAHGIPVTLADTSPDALARAREHHAARLDDAGRALVRYATEPAVADLIIEAIPERLELKRTLFAQLDALCPPETLIATNSSSLRIDQIEDVARHRERLLNIHFFGPVDERPMVELMGGAQTSEATLARAEDWARRIGMVPLRVRKPSTGFLFNRVWRAIKKEVMTVADTGVASIEDIDRAWMVFQNQKMGPFGLMDLIGLDVILDIERVYHRESGDDRDAPPQLLTDLVERGDLGVKTGRGFYTYPDPAWARPDFLRGK